jgi:endonuclease I
LRTPSFDNNNTPRDGHHIRASDVQRNGQRSNQKFADGSETSKNATGGWCPSDEWKGDVTPIIMYMGTIVNVFLLMLSWKRSWYLRRYDRSFP